jgi:hypothetical protein
MSEDDFKDLEVEVEQAEESDAGVTELPAPVDWMALSAYEWQEEIGRLRLWVGQIVTEWALPSRVVLPCWEQHGALVQLLGSLRDAYDTLYHEMQPGTGSVDWQRYWSWARAELATLTGALSCTASEHSPDRLQDWARSIAEDGESSEVFMGEDSRVDLAVRNHLEKGRVNDSLNVTFVDFTKGR